MHEIDFRNATFEDIEKFTMNMLHYGAGNGAPDAEREMRLAYFSSMSRILLERKASENLQRLAQEIDQARSGLARGLDKLAVAVSTASDASTAAAAAADIQAKRMVRATWGLVAATLALGLATGFLVYYTRALVHSEAPIAVSAPIEGARR